MTVLFFTNKDEHDPSFVNLLDLNVKRGVLSECLTYNYGDFIPILRPFLKGYFNICKETCEKRMHAFDTFREERKKLISSTNKRTNHEGFGFAGIDHLLESQKKGGNQRR
ncbi:hypothetical protein PanWU01x14_063100 [Parasponia andersonii]|uniref:Uncharacterized protein n=1 Tax=Parasponia andersonii TaxID=3476 RepID=A0A2P5DHU2_PARAD|nr:hypothetical protein PanWU01x14_063100 [Parasponia andersonii]